MGKIAVALFAVAAFQATPGPLRVGAVARALPDQDVADIVRVASVTGPQPWLISGFCGQLCGYAEGVGAYLPPEKSTSEFRRGTFVTLERRLLKWSIISSLPIPLSDTGQPVWVVKGHGSYTQVAVPDRQFESINGDQDINRPFAIDGSFDDDELVRLARFIRSSPAGPSASGDPVTKSIHGDWPILSVTRTGDKISVRIREKELSWQDITLVARQSDWTIVSIRHTFA